MHFFHIHFYNTPICSMYVSFSQRHIIYQCRCGKRKAKMIFRQYGDAFPIKTSNLMTRKEFNGILNTHEN